MHCAVSNEIALIRTKCTECLRFCDQISVTIGPCELHNHEMFLRVIVVNLRSHESSFNRLVLFDRSCLATHTVPDEMYAAMSNDAELTRPMYCLLLVTNRYDWSTEIIQSRNICAWPYSLNDVLKRFCKRITASLLGMERKKVMKLGFCFFLWEKCSFVYLFKSKWWKTCRLHKSTAVPQYTVVFSLYVSALWSRRVVQSSIDVFYSFFQQHKRTNRRSQS